MIRKLRAPQQARLSLGVAAALLTLAACSALAGANADWAAIEDLDRGPAVTPRTKSEAVRVAKEHLARQRAAVRDFVVRYPGDARVVDARVRLASITAAVGKMENNPGAVNDALRQLHALENAPNLPAAKRADIAFRRIYVQLQNYEGRADDVRDRAVTAAGSFAERFPSDVRSPRLLVEAATLCDQSPDLKRRLLEKAHTLSREPALNARIADDLKRLNALGKPLVMKFDTIQGGRFDLSAQRGNVVVLLFWAADSPQSLLWFRQFRQALARLPAERLRAATISLDSNRTELERQMREFGIGNWPTHFDGRGWDSAIARPLGINAIPTLWIVDKRGVLRVINARDNYDVWLQRLLRENP